MTKNYFHASPESRKCAEQNLYPKFVTRRSEKWLFSRHKEAPATQGRTDLEPARFHTFR